MEPEYEYSSDGEGYATIGGSPAWEILPIWLYITAALSAYDALQAFVPSLSKRVLFARYPSCAWQERTSLAARQFGAMNLLLTVARVHAGMSIHVYGAYNVGILSAAILLVHFVSERLVGSIRGSALSAAEVAAFVTFVWMMVQREAYVVQNVPDVGGGAGLMHPTQGGPYYPDRPYVGGM